MKCVRKRQDELQNRLLCFISLAGCVSYVRAHNTLSSYFFSHPHRSVVDMDGLINPYCTCSNKASNQPVITEEAVASGGRLFVGTVRERVSRPTTKTQKEQRAT